MQTNIFLDINIVLDMMDITRKNHANSLKVLEISIMKNMQIFISEDMLSTIYYINSDKKYALTFFQKMIQKWKIVSFGKEVIEQALEFCLANGGDLEDALQCFCAKNNGCTFLLTNDKKFNRCGISIVGYEDFLAL
jgi:predicted nucleic acid-binding protein